MSIGFDFWRECEELATYIKQKKPSLHFDYDEIMHSSHHKAFTVAKVTKLDLLRDIQDSLQKAVQKGVPFKQWQENIIPTLKKYGWWGEVEVINPKTKERKNIHVGSRRLKTIYDTNIRVAYAQGQYEQIINNNDLPYLRYTAILDAHTRPAHAKLHNVILLKDDPFWDRYYPPNDWKCRCKVQALTESSLKARGLKITKNPPLMEVHKDWDYHVGKKDNIKKVWTDKIESLHVNCKEANARKNRPCHKELYKKARLEYVNTQIQLQQRVRLYKAIKNLFVTNEAKKVFLTKSAIFGSEKNVYLSRDTIQSHFHHKEIGAYDYSRVPLMLENSNKRVFKGKDDRHIVIVSYLGRNYRLVLKNIENKNEIFVVSLFHLRDIEKEIRLLKKKGEIK